MSSRLLPLVAPVAPLLLLLLLLLLSPPLDGAATGPRRNLRHPGRPKPPCCVEVSSQDISRWVTGTTYRRPSDRKPCVQAIILNTARGSVCVDPAIPWVRKVIANKTEE